MMKKIQLITRTSFLIMNTANLSPKNLCIRGTVRDALTYSAMAPTVFGYLVVLDVDLVLVERGVRGLLRPVVDCGYLRVLKRKGRSLSTSSYTASSVEESGQSSGLFVSPGIDNNSGEEGDLKIV